MTPVCSDLVRILFCEEIEFMSKRLYIGNLPFTATEEEIRSLLKTANLPPDGKTTVFDGYTGESFLQKVKLQKQQI